MKIGHRPAPLPPGEETARAGVLPGAPRVRMFRSGRAREARTMDAEIIWPGRPYPLGATSDGEGTNFAVYARHAEQVDLCLFDATDPSREVRRTPLREKTGHVFHAYLPGLRPGTLYGFRAHGPYEPARGLRFNPAKLLVDPYARAITGEVDFDGPVFGYPLGAPEQDLARDDRDSAAAMPKGVVVADDFDWSGDRRPETPWHRSVIYEVHVKGFTARHPEVPPELRGTYLGLASPPAIEHLVRLGVTAVELLPVQEFVDDPFLRGARPHELLGLLDARLLRPRAEVRVREPRRAGPRVPPDGEGAARRGDRGHPRRRLQPHRGGEPPRPHPVAQGARQPELLPARGGRPAPLLGHHRLRELAQHDRPAGAEARDGLAPLLGGRDARGRVPVRPRGDARARSAAFDVRSRFLVRGPPGSAARAGEAHLRAVGRRPRRLPRGRLPGALVGVERQVPRRRPPLLEGRPGARGRDGLPAHRLGRSVRGGGAEDLRVGELRHRARRVHAARSRLLRPQAQRGERRGEPRRLRRQPLLELRGGGRDRGSGGARAARPAGAEPPRDAPRLAGRPDDLGRRRAGPHAAREQQRVLPGQRALLARLEPRRPAPRPPRLHAAARAAAALAAGAAAAALLPRRDPVGLVAQGPRLVPPRRRGDERGRLEQALRPLGRLPARRRHDRDPGRARRTDRRRHAPRPHERLARGGHLPPPRHRAGGASGRSSSTRPARPT